MNKKYLVSVIFTGALLFAGSAMATTNCDNQAKPVTDCPIGYLMMCISAIDKHWGCAKDVNGILYENVSSATDGGLTITGLKEVPAGKNINFYERMKANEKSLDTFSTEKILPTVNQEEFKEECPPGQIVVEQTNSIPPSVICGPSPVADVMINNKQNVGKQDTSTSKRLLPIVNKKTGAKVLVRGWDSEKQNVMLEKVQTEVENNPELKTVEVTDYSVGLDYSAPAKLFGFIPLRININISHTGDKVRVSFPWYRFMISTSFSNTAEVINEVLLSNQTDLEFLKAKDSSKKQLEIFIKISNTLKAIRDTSK